MICFLSVLIYALPTSFIPLVLFSVSDDGNDQEDMEDDTVMV